MLTFFKCDNFRHTASVWTLQPHSQVDSLGIVCDLRPTVWPGTADSSRQVCGAPTHAYVTCPPSCMCGCLKWILSPQSGTLHTMSHGIPTLPRCKQLSPKVESIPARVSVTLPIKTITAVIGCTDQVGSQCALQVLKLAVCIMHDRFLDGASINTHGK
jgi:hypothetical protein